MKLGVFKVLSQKEIELIHKSSLRLLSEVGITIYSDKVLNLLKKNGVEVDFGKKLVKFSVDMVEEALRYIPQKIVLYNREREPTVTLGEGKSYLINGHNAPYVLDLETGQRRKACKKDAEDFAIVTDALDSFYLTAPQVMPQDVLPQASLLYAVQEILSNTQKPLYFSPEGIDVAEPIFNMAKVVMGKSDLSKFPILICQLSPTSPLMWESGPVEALIEAATLGIPCSILSMPHPGLTAPYTLAGTLVMCNAEVLSGLIMTQLAKKGAPGIYGSAWITFDMQKARALEASPETDILRIAGSQLADFYKIPYHTTLNSDSYCLDEQTAWEKSISLFTAIGAEADLIVNAGILSTGLTVSFEQLVIDSEIWGILLHIIQGVKVSHENVAIEIIKKVKERGRKNFLTEEHTLRRLRTSEFWKPLISVRCSYEEWKKKGGLDVVKSAKEKVREVLQMYTSTHLEPKIQEELSLIIEDFEERLRRARPCEYVSN